MNYELMQRHKHTFKELKSGPGCGTVGCIAGWGAVYFSKTGREYQDNTARYRAPLSVTSAHLGLDYDEAHYLYRASWNRAGEFKGGKAAILKYMRKALAEKNVFVTI
jgi:hypothetical protein